MEFWVYILKSIRYGKYYVGQTKEIGVRLDQHNNGYEKSTSPFAPWELIWVGTKSTRGEAMKLEKKLKNLSKQRLEVFISKYIQGRDAAKGWSRC